MSDNLDQGKKTGPSSWSSGRLRTLLFLLGAIAVLFGVLFSNPAPVRRDATLAVIVVLTYCVLHCLIDPGKWIRRK